MNPTEILGSHPINKPHGMKDEDCSSLPVLRATYTLPSGDEVPCMVAAFIPTPEELRLLVHGGAVYLHVLGEVFQPVVLATQNMANSPIKSEG